MREATIQARMRRLMFGALAVLALMLPATTTVLAAGTETTTSSSTSYTVSNPTKAMRKATALINAEDYRAALIHLETEVAANPKNAGMRGTRPLALPPAVWGITAGQKPPMTRR